MQTPPFFADKRKTGVKVFFRFHPSSFRLHPSLHCVHTKETKNGLRGTDEGVEIVS
jgi:hypothetical protein